MIGPFEGRSPLMGQIRLLCLANRVIGHFINVSCKHVIWVVLRVVLVPLLSHLQYD